MKAHKITSVALLLLVLLGLFGFGGTSALAKSPTTIEFWFWTAANWVNDFKELADAFEKDNPDIKVKLVYAPWGEFFTKLQTRIAAGSPPDVSMLSVLYINDYVDRGLLEDLQPRVDKDLNMADYYASMFAQGKKGYPEKLGDQYAIPAWWNNVVLFYNKDMFDKADLKYPDWNWTWDDLLATAKKLTIDTNKDGKPDQYGFYDLYNISYYPFLWQAGGDMTDPTGTKFTLDKPEAIDGLKFKADLTFRYHVAPDPKVIPPPAANNPLLAGYAAMEPAYSLMAFDKAYRDSKINWDVAPLPKGKVRATQGNPDSLVIYKQAKHKEEAWRFIRFLLSEKGQKSVVSRIAFPVLKKVAESPEFLGQFGKKNMKVVLDQEKYARIYPYNIDYSKAVNDAMSEIWPIFTGDVTVDEAVKRAEKAWDAAVPNK